MNDRALAERLRRLENRVALNELVARYCHLLDDREYSELADLFAPDGKFFRQHELSAAGTEALRAFFGKAGSTFSASFHYPHSHIVTFSSDETASGIVSAHAEMGIDDELVLAGLRYDDLYVLHEGRWKFLERRLHFRYRSALVDLNFAYGRAQVRSNSM